MSTMVHSSDLWPISITQVAKMHTAHMQAWNEAVRPQTKPDSTLEHAIIERTRRWSGSFENGWQQTLMASNGLWWRAQYNRN